MTSGIKSPDTLWTWACCASFYKTNFFTSVSAYVFRKICHYSTFLLELLVLIAQHVPASEVTIFVKLLILVIPDYSPYSPWIVWYPYYFSTLICPQILQNIFLSHSFRNAWSAFKRDDAYAPVCEDFFLWRLYGKTVYKAKLLRSLLWSIVYSRSTISFTTLPTQFFAVFEVASFFYVCFLFLDDATTLCLLLHGLLQLLKVVFTKFLFFFLLYLFLCF